MIKMLDMTEIQKYYVARANEKARLRNITVNGNRATVVFSEYVAPEELIDEFRKEDGTDGHFYYITFFIWNGVRSYWTDKEISTKYTFLTNREEGNEIYKEIRATGKFDRFEEY